MGAVLRNAVPERSTDPEKGTHMSRKFISFVLATAVTVTGFAATPTRADSNEVSTLLNTLATITLLRTAQNGGFVSSVQDPDERRRLLHEQALRQHLAEKAAKQAEQDRAKRARVERDRAERDRAERARAERDRSRQHEWDRRGHGWRDGDRSWTRDRRDRHDHQGKPYGRDRDHGWNGPGRKDKPRYHPRARAPLPSQCIRVVRVKGKTRQIFGTRCLDRQYRDSRRLPEVCRLTYRSDRGLQSGYVRRCMRKQGYDIAWN